jgi:hypothetical protein
MLWPYTAKLLKVIVRSSIMADPVTAIVGSTVASVGGSLIGGSQASKAAGKAADTQADATRYAAELQREQFERGVSLQDPFRRAGVAGQNELLRYLGITPEVESRGSIADRLAYDLPAYASMSTQQRTDAINNEVRRQQALAATAKRTPEFGSLMRDFSMKDFTTDPGYAFRMSEGLKGLDRTAAARGGLISGAALKAAQRFGQDLGSQEYMNAFNRYQTNRANKLNPLQSLAGVGQTTSQQLATQGQQYGQNVGELALQGANARASGYVGQANALNQSIGSMANAIGQGVGMYNFMRPTAPVASYGFSSVPGSTGVGAFL